MCSKSYVLKKWERLTIWKGESTSELNMNRIKGNHIDLSLYGRRWCRGCMLRADAHTWGSSCHQGVCMPCKNRYHTSVKASSSWCKLWAMVTTYLYYEYLTIKSVVLPAAMYMYDSFTYNADGVDKTTALEDGKCENCRAVGTIRWWRSRRDYETRILIC